MVEDVGDEDADEEEAAEDVEDATELDAAELNPFAPAKIAAIAGFELRNPAVTSPTGYSPSVQGLLLQQPMKGGVVAAHVYQLLDL